MSYFEEEDVPRDLSDVVHHLRQCSSSLVHTRISILVEVRFRPVFETTHLISLVGVSY